LKVNNQRQVDRNPDKASGSFTVLKLPQCSILEVFATKTPPKRQKPTAFFTDSAEG
jgi:hypothetical protein